MIKLRVRVTDGSCHDHEFETAEKAREVVPNIFAHGLHAISDGMEYFYPPCAIVCAWIFDEKPSTVED